MNWTGGTATLYEATNRVTRVVVLQVTWLGFVLAGGILLGLFPAWFALLLAVKREVRGEPMKAKEIWQDFLRFFWPANALGYATSVPVGAGLTQFFFLPGEEGLLYGVAAMVVPFTTFWLAYWTANAWVFLADDEAISVAGARATLVPILLQPVRSLVLLAGVVAAFVVFVFLPAVALAAGAPLLALLMTKIGRPDRRLRGVSTPNGL